MAIQAVSLVVLWFFAFSTAQNTCGEVQCKLVPVERDVALAFQKLASEKGVRLVYFNLQIGNGSFHPLESKERFLAERWLWVKTKREPMLMILRKDYNIHYLGLLKYQVRYMNVQLEEQPTGCLVRLNTSCQDNVVGETLLGNVKKESSGKRLPPTDHVCTAYVMNSSIGIGNYMCCSVQNLKEMNDSLIRCGIPLESDWFGASFYAVSYIFKIMLLCYCPAIPLLLPDFIFNIQNAEYDREKSDEQQLRNNQVAPDKVDKQESEIELEPVGSGDRRTDEEINQVLSNQQTLAESTDLPQNKYAWTDLSSSSSSSSSVSSEEQEHQLTSETSASEIPLDNASEIPLDDASPITFCALLGDYAKKLPYSFKMNFNLKLIFLCFVVFPFYIYLKFVQLVIPDVGFYNERFKKIGTDCGSPNQPSYALCSIALAFSQPSMLNVWTTTQQVTVVVTVFMILTLIRPKDFLNRPYVFCLLCQFLALIKPGIKIGHTSLRQQILQHLNEQRECVYEFAFIVLSLYVSTVKRFLTILTPRRLLRESRRRRTLRTLCAFLSVLPGLLFGVALGTICILIFLTALVFLIFALSPLTTVYFFVITGLVIAYFLKTRPSGENTADFFAAPVVLKVKRLLAFCLLTFLFVASFLFAIAVLPATIHYISDDILLTIMGLVLNLEFVTPYVVFILVVAGNMYLCYSNLQSRYKEVKVLISKHWQQETKELPRINCSSIETIPKDLFWFVCNNNNNVCDNGDDSDSSNEFYLPVSEEQGSGVLPLRTEICFIFA